MTVSGSTLQGPPRAGLVLLGPMDIVNFGELVALARDWERLKRSHLLGPTPKDLASGVALRRAVHLLDCYYIALVLSRRRLLT